MSGNEKANAGNKEAYRQLCAEVNDIPVFAQGWYLDAIPAPYQWEAVLVQEKGEVVAALPYVTRRRLGFRISDMPPLVKFLGPWLAPDRRDLSRQHKYLTRLIEGLPRLDSFQQDFYYPYTNWLPFYWRGFRQTTRYSYRLRLDDLDRVWSGIKGNVRREVRQAEDQLAIRHDLGLGEFYRVLSLTFERQGMHVPLSYPYLKSLDEALLDRQARQLLFAVDREGRTHSVVYLIRDRQCAYYHMAGDDPALRHSHGGKLLTWAGIRYAREEWGSPLFDFEGSMLPAIEPLRRRFGAEQVPYLRVWKDWNPLYRWAREWRR